MVLGFLRRLSGAREKPSPLEALGMLPYASAVDQQGGGGPLDLYTLLEDEKIGRELWALILGFVARDTKLTYFTPEDEEYLFWKIEALATRIEAALNSQAPPPDRFPTIEDYVKTVEAQRLLAENLRVYMLAVVRRSFMGFERRLQATRQYIISPGHGRW